jgi:hypothetical protein
VGVLSLRATLKVSSKGLSGFLNSHLAIN